MAVLVTTDSLASAAKRGPFDEMIKGAYQQILGAADKNGDGKLSMAECTSIFAGQSQERKGLQILGCKWRWNHY